MGDPKRGASPLTGKLMLVKWLGLFPVPLAVVHAIEILPIDPPIPLELLMETTIVVPLPDYVTMPLMDDPFVARLHASTDTDGRASGDVGR